MAEKKVHQGSLTDEDTERREIFLATYCKDATESFKQLFTLNSAVFVFFATFAKDKLFHSQSSVSMALLPKTIYASLASSLILCILGLYLLQMAAEKATNLNLWDYRFPLGKYSTYWGFALVANWLLEGAGVLFICAVLLIGSALL